MKAVTSNRLAKEKSPYLREHASDPVDWYPWCDEAFSRAKRENKPVFVTIGYSTCHWCHVMQEETFSDEEVAKMMNEAFVNIAVDREERPDIDRTYIKVAQVMHGNAGWPLNVILTPDKKPFFSATYIPRDDRYDMPGMKTLIRNARALWSKQRRKLESDSNKIVDLLSSEAYAEASKTIPGKDSMEGAFGQFSGMFDSVNGGFSAAPKFPMPVNLMFLLRYWKRTRNGTALAMVERTLQAIRRGGIFDHVGFGVHRYAVDSGWIVPHFEKMLYDQALIASACTEAYQATKDGFYIGFAEELVTFMLEHLRSQSGGFYTGIDADSDGVEGKFYLWSETDLKGALSVDEFEFAKKVFCAETGGNFHSESADTGGYNILHMRGIGRDVAKGMGITPAAFARKLEGVRKKLYKAREKRVHPSTDTKILADINGLAISALAKCEQVTGNKAYSDAAEKCAKFVLSNMLGEYRLLHSFSDGEASVDGFVDDYAFMAFGLIDLYESTFNDDYLDAALDLMDKLVGHFWDKKNFGFFYAADYSERVLMRDKESYDGVLPSGNAIALMNLVELSRLMGRNDLEDYADKMLRTFSAQISRQPLAHTQFLSGLDFVHGPTNEIVIVKGSGEKGTDTMVRTIRQEFLPNKIIAIRTDRMAEMASFMKPMKSINSKATAYVCTGYACSNPTTSIESVLSALGVR